MAADDTVTVSRAVLEAALSTSTLALQVLLGQQTSNAALATEVSRLTATLQSQASIGARVGEMLKRVQAKTAQPVEEEG